MDLRPQAHDIIRTWLFSTVLRAQLEHGSLPWHHAAISGFVTDPDRKKMSKSKGNVVTPLALLEEHGSDGVRYWATKGGPGVDTIFDAAQMKVGRRLAIKVLNASKFILTKADPIAGRLPSPVDRAMLSSLASVIEEATEALDDYEYGRAIDLVEREFWGFCDDYLEFVKGRRYGDQGSEAAGSANAALVGGAVRLCAIVCAVSAVCHRRSVVVVEDRIGASRARGRREENWSPLMRGSGRRPAEVDLRARCAGRGAQAEVGSKAAVESADCPCRDRG